jgi:hypothetical protein
MQSLVLLKGNEDDVGLQLNYTPGRQVSLVEMIRALPWPI